MSHRGSNMNFLAIQPGMLPGLVGNRGLITADDGEDLVVEVRRELLGLDLDLLDKLARGRHDERERPVRRDCLHGPQPEAIRAIVSEASPYLKHGPRWPPLHTTRFAPWLKGAARCCNPPAWLRRHTARGFGHVPA